MLLDNIASLLDDISLMTKVSARKTASVLGDDLALNAEQVSGVRAEPAVDSVLSWLTPHLLHALIGILVAMLVVGLFKLKAGFKREA